MVVAEAVVMLKSGQDVTCKALAKRCKCARGTIVYHFGGIDEVKRRAEYEVSTEKVP
jgi:AcrR family transcriptional regulator